MKAIKITLRQYPEPLFFEALKYNNREEEERVIAYAANTFPEGMTRVRNNDIGVSRVAVVRPVRRPFLNGQRISSNSLFALNPAAIAAAEIIELDEQQSIPELPESFIAQTVDSSEPQGQILDPGNDLQAGNYYLATDRQGVSGRVYIRQIHQTGERIDLLEIVFDDGGQRVVTADSFQWRADDQE